MTRLRTLAPVLALALLLVLPLSLAAQTGLHASSGPPRTLRAYTHIWVAFSVTWLLLFGYAVMLGRRFKALEAQVVRLGGER